MPTERFYRLSEEKRQIIKEAAFREFSRVPLDKVSINQMIKDAEISRGSFYTYFEDKWDVLSYILEESQKEMQECIYTCLERLNGDMWKTLDAFFLEIVGQYGRAENQNFFKNVMKYTDADDMFLSAEKSQRPDFEAAGEDVARWLYTHYSRETMREMSIQEFNAFFMMAIAAMAIEMRRFFEGKALEDVLEGFHMKLSILRQGVASEQKSK